MVFPIYLTSTIKNLFPDVTWLFDFITGKDATEEFEDAGHSKSAKELMETMCIGELDTDTYFSPELENQPTAYPQKLMDLTKQYWAVPAAVVGISMVVGFLYLRKK
jgi:cytochrome b involved in lipid metabolism